MRKIRGILLWLLAGSMLLTAGCGAEESREEEPQVKEEETEAADSGGSAGNILQIAFSDQSADEYDPESGQWLAHVAYQTAEVDGGGSEGAAQAIRQWSEERAREIRELRTVYAALAADDAAFAEPTEYYRYSVTQSLETARVDDRVVSLVEMNSEYTGGAHGSYGSTGINFDAESGAMLKLADILTDEEGFREKAGAYLIDTLSERYGEELFPGYEDVIDQMWEGDPNWYLDAAGVAFIFTPYAIGPYAMGEVSVTFPYTEAAGYLSEDYLPGWLKTPDFSAAVAKIPAGEIVSLYASALDSQPEALRVWLDGGEEGYGPVRVELDGVSEETEYFERIGDGYLVHRPDGRTFVIFDADYASDDFVTFVYEIRDRTITACDRKEGLTLRDGSVNTDSLRLHMHLDVLGTYSGRMDYTFGSDGQLVASDRWFEISGSGDPWREMQTIRDLPVRIGGEEAMLPAGSTIRITATDNEGTVRFEEVKTGQEGEISYVRGDQQEDTWTIHIDGIPDYEYLETIPYAG